MSIFETAIKRIHGLAAHDAAVSGNPVAIGARAGTALPSAVGNGDASWVLVDKYGRVVQATSAPVDKWISGVTGAITDTSAHTVIAAQGAGTKIYVTDILVTNASEDTGTLVTIQDSASNVLWRGYAAAGGGGFAVRLATPVAAGDNAAVQVICGTTAASVYVSLSGFIGA